MSRWEYHVEPIPVRTIDENLAIINLLGDAG
jgi:hypothetical protein